MSLFRLPKLRRLASTFENVRKSLAGGPDRSVSQRAFRRLQIDPLEQRQLLALDNLSNLSVENIDEIAVNQQLISVLDAGDFPTESGHSVAVDHDGDFVIAWTKYDEVIDPDTGLPAVDPETGNTITDANIYARYYTDEVQRLTLPMGVLDDLNPSTYGRFDLSVGGNEVQKITVSATYRPFGFAQADIVGDFTLGFDVNGDSVITPGVETTTIANYREVDATVSTIEHLENLAEQLRVGLSGIGGALTDVEVEAVNAREFLIHFGDASRGLNQPQIVVGDGIFAPAPNFTSGFLPAVVVSTVNQPVVLTNIPISPDDPELTALAIEQRFLTTSDNFAVGPIDFPPRDRVFAGGGSDDSPYLVPDRMRVALPRVEVTPLAMPEVQTVTIAGTPTGGTYVLHWTDGNGVTYDTAAIAYNATASQVQAALRLLPGLANVTVASRGTSPNYTHVVTFADVTESVSQLTYTNNLTGGGIAVATVRDWLEWATTFDVTFVKDSGKKDQPELKVRAVRNDSGLTIFNNADNREVHLLTIDATGSGPLSGFFQLEIGGTLTNNITFDSANLPAVAAAIQAELVAAGYPGVVVTATSTSDPYQFTIRFDRADVPPVHYVATLDPVTQLPLLDAVGTGTEILSTIKETSPELRANPVEVDNPFTSRVDVYNQRNPAVAMDSDGDFVITWDSEIPQSVNFGSVNDIFAQRYAPLGGASNVVAAVANVVSTTVFSGSSSLSAADDYYNGWTLKFADDPAYGALQNQRVVVRDYVGATRTFTLAAALPAVPVVGYSFSFLNGVKTSADFFQVNEFTTNSQHNPHVGMDDAGNFTIAWANEGQDISFFNGITARRFDRYGEALGPEFMVNDEDTAIHYNPFVAMSGDGHVAVTWSRTYDPDYIVPGPFVSEIWAAIYNPSATELVNQLITGGANSSAAFDANNDVVFSWSAANDADTIPDGNAVNMGVRAAMWSLYNDAGAFSFTQIRSEFRANSASQTPTDVPTWPYNQGLGLGTRTEEDQEWPLGHNAVLDADGDLAIVYDGYGPDVSENIDQILFDSTVNNIMREVLMEQINATTNADLLPYFDPSVDSLPFITNFQGFIGDAVGDVWTTGGTLYSATGGDIDAAIEEVLYYAASPLIHPADAANANQLGRLRAILDGVAGLLRGEAYSALFSRWDADPQISSGIGDIPLNNLFSDSVINAQRDGHNRRQLVLIPEDTAGGSFVVSVNNGMTGFFSNVTITPVIESIDVAGVAVNVVDIYNTAVAIDDAIESATTVGASWPESTYPNRYEGPVDVRIVSTPGSAADPDPAGRIGDQTELDVREGTNWALPAFYEDYYVYEVTFQGSVHDVQMSIPISSDALVGQPIDEVQILTFSGNLANGYFALDIGGNVTADIMWDAANPLGVAGNIQSSIDAAGYADVQVISLGGNRFQVTFRGGSGGTDQPAIAQGTPAADPATQPIFNGNIGSTTVTQGSAGPEVFPLTPVMERAWVGTIQSGVAMAMEPDGDAVAVWSQLEETTGRTDTNFSVSYRRFDESTDTAGPRLTDLVDQKGNKIDSGDEIVGPVSYLVLTFDEEMLGASLADIQWALGQRDTAIANRVPIPTDVQRILDSVTNLENYALLNGAVEIVGGIAQINFGMNEAARLSGEINPLTGDVYDLDPVPTNRWEVVITLDGNGYQPGITPLTTGQYTVLAYAPVAATTTTYAQSGLRDAAGNPLGRTGFDPDGRNMSRSFTVVADDGGGPGPGPGGEDEPVSTAGVNGRTHPETPGAVGMDGDGDHVIVWTGFDPATGRNRINYRQYEADGSTPAVNPGIFEVTPVAQFPAFSDVDQRYGSVAIDADGDFVVTWTQYDPVLDDQGQPVIDPNTQQPVTEANIYARRFWANGDPRNDGPLGGAPFMVNTYTDDNQIWSNIAMDVDGDFIVTWSSYSQEDGGQLGTGYGVYARRYDSLGQPMAPEFLVNVTTEGDQQFSSVAMDNLGGFVVTWTSNQNGVGTDIIARTYWPDGTPQPSGIGTGYLYGEILVNQTTNGNQYYPDVAMAGNGTSYVVTWTGPDGNGNGVFARKFGRQSDPTGDQRAIYEAPLATPVSIPDTGSIISTFTVNDSFAIADLDLRLDITHARVSDLQVYLTSPSGTRLLVVDRVPRDVNGNPTTGQDMNATVLNDGAPVSIANAAAPFSGEWAPSPDLLSAFNGEDVQGTWTLEVLDLLAGPYEVDPTPNDDVPPDLLLTYLNDWSLDVAIGVQAGSEFRVNTTVPTNQSYSSVSMDQSSNFVITWTGRGEQLNEEDTDGYGVFYQQYDTSATRVGGETRVNNVVTGQQWFSSVDSDHEGNFVIAWTGPGQVAGTTGVYRFASSNVFRVTETEGPMVTGVMRNGAIVFDGDVLVSSPEGITTLIVLFDEDLSIRDTDLGPDSVLNADNWVIERNGSELAGGIADITFQRDPATRKWQALVTFDGNGLGLDPSGTPPGLEPADYRLIVRDNIMDPYTPDPRSNPPNAYFGGNRLDGDFDGSPGTLTSTGTGYTGYAFHFTVTAGPKLGAEVRVNESPNYEQRLSAAKGTGYGYEESTRSVAVDNDGDFVVAWTSYGQDNAAEPMGAGVYMRLYDRNDNAITPEFLVNTITVGNQRNAAVAMDADGDFVVVWESRDPDPTRNPDGSWDVYARRFDAMGNPVVSDTNRNGVIDAADTTAQFLVNTDTANDQLNPAVGMDDFGNFVVVWATKGQSYSYFNNVHAQLFDLFGRAVDEEFRVNEMDIPGTENIDALPGSTELNPAVAMNGIGDFVVAWDLVTDQRNGVITNGGVVARMFDRFGKPRLNSNPDLITPDSDEEFQVNVGDNAFVSDSEHTGHVAAAGSLETRRTARNPQVAIDDRGAFVIAWEAFQDNDIEGATGPESYGIYFRRFNPDGTADPADTDHQANLVITSAGTVIDANINSESFAYSQVNPSVAMDADGDYSLVWNGNGAVPHPLDPTTHTVTNKDFEGVWIRDFHAQDIDETENEAVGVQTRVNMSDGGIQQFPSIAMEPDGDKIVVWSGNGVADRHGVFARRYNETSDTAGPQATELRTGDGALLYDAAYTSANLLNIVVVFDERMSVAGGATGAGSVLNPANWVLRDANGNVLSNRIYQVQFGLSMSNTLGLGSAASNKWEAVITFDGNGLTGGIGPTPLAPGYYELTAGADLEDVAGNKLRRTGYLPGSRSSQLDQPVDDWERATPYGFAVAGTPFYGEEFRVNETTTGDQAVSEENPYDVPLEDSTRAVAVDHDGDFVVVWTSYGQDDPIDAAGGGVYMRMFDRNNVPLTGETLVNTTFEGNQWRPAVAIDADGEFVVTWQSDGQDDDGSDGIYARRYNSIGTPLGGEFRVNTNYTQDQSNPAIGMDDYGNFVIAWETSGQSFSFFNDIHAQIFNYDGVKVGSEFRVNSENLPGPVAGQDGIELNPAVAMAPNGTFVVVWERLVEQQLGVATNSNVMGRMFDAVGNPLVSQITGNTNEFQVNVSDAAFLGYATHTPAMAAGNGQTIDPDLDGDADPNTGVIYTMTRTARNAQVAMDGEGNFVVVWESFQDNDVDQSGNPDSQGIYFRPFAVVTNTTTGLLESLAITASDMQANEVRTTATGSVPDDFGRYFAYEQVNPSIAIDADGDFSVVWDGNGVSVDGRLTDETDAVLISEWDQEGVWITDFAAGGIFDTGDPAAPTQITYTPNWIDYQTRVNRTGYGVQQFPAIAMEPDGDAVVVWSGYGVGDSQGVFARRYNEQTDTAGPMVTEFLLPTGQRLQPDHQISEPLTTIIVVFDEQMMNVTANAVTNPANYELLKNGVPFEGGIANIDFRLNAATNKWEAVVTLDGNGVEPGVPAVVDGHWQLVALNSLRDVAGNPLGGTGLAPNGAAATLSLDVAVSTGGESRVNDSVAGDQTMHPYSGQQVASDADGDYVVVWTDNAAGREGLYAKMYDVVWTGTGDNRTSTVAPMPVQQPNGAFWPNNEILITSDPTADYASVARDIDGDWVVTWSAQNAASDWDVYAQRYDAAGNPIGSTFVVNSELENAQMYSAVAMDGDGDFVITWQSFDQSDDDTWDIYAQRYSPLGYVVGGGNEYQMISFIGGITGTFGLSWDHDNDPATPDRVTAGWDHDGNPATPNVAIDYSGNAAATAAQIEAALLAIGVEVEAQAISSTQIGIRFIGANGGKNVASLALDPAQLNMVGGPDASVSLVTRAEGSAGEFLVNSTTPNHQMWPAIDMDTNGNFVISWTSFGQDGDAAYESNIYARRFPSNDVLWGIAGSNFVPYDGASSRIAGAHYDPFIVSTDAEANHLVAAGSGRDGVVQVFVGGGYGSGTLLRGGQYVLTAAHVVWDTTTGAPIDPAFMAIAFDTAAGRVLIPADQVYVTPNYNGDPFDGGDIAVIHLAYAAPAGVETYDIYRGSDEIQAIGQRYGYGMTGTGAVGSVVNPNDLKRFGYNLYESSGTLLGASSDLLAYDFDDGTPAHDAFGQVFGMNNLGLGPTMEVSSAPGDSGGPTFINGQVAAVCTGGVHIPGGQDLIPGINSSFGDFGVDTRVSAYATWIDSVTQYGGAEFLVNENDPQRDAGGNQITGTLANNNQAGNQKWSSVAMDPAGDFVITWTGYGQDGVGDGYGAGQGGLNGVYVRRFTAGNPEFFRAGDPLSDAHLVNTFVEENQQYSQVAMDASGDFVVVWESFQDRPVSPNPDAPNSYGIYAQRYSSVVAAHLDPFAGPGGEVGGELAINTTKDGDQRYPSVAMDDTGDFVVVWSGNGQVAGQADTQGIFQRRFENVEDVAGPTVGNVLNVVTNGVDILLKPVYDGSVLPVEPTQFVIPMGENVSTFGFTSGSTSILNREFWSLTKNGSLLVGGIASVDYGYSMTSTNLANAASQKFEVVLTFDGDFTTPGLQPLGRGVYELTLNDNVEDLFDNILDGNFDGALGGAFTRQFAVLTDMIGDTEPGSPGAPGGPTLPGDPDVESDDVAVNTTTAGNQDSVAVASSDEGDHVVVWVNYTGATPEGTILGQRYDRFGRTVGQEFAVATIDTGNQIQPDVAMDRFGNFVVTWSGNGDQDDSGIFARVYDAHGVALGEQFRVNEQRWYIQDEPAVAADANGDFVIAWTTYGSPQGDANVFARRFSFRGEPMGSEFQVNTTVASAQRSADVSMDHDGNFVVVWQSWAQDNGLWGVLGQRYDVNGQRLGGEFQINQTGVDAQMEPAVAMDANGDFVVTWSSWLQDGSQWGVYARRYNAAGQPQTGEFLVNQVAAYSQYQPAVAIDDGGQFVITWTTYAQDMVQIDVRDYGIFARIFNPDGSDYLAPDTGLPMGEFRINATMTGNQVGSAVAMDEDGDFVVAWTGPDRSNDPAVPSTGTDVYTRVVAVNPDSYIDDGILAAAGYAGTFSTYVNAALQTNPDDPTTAVLSGTSGNDVFEFVAGSNPAAWTVKVNGVLQNISANAIGVHFNGGAGSDTVILTGTDGADVLALGMNHGSLTFGDYAVSVSNVESITANGGAGRDTATLFDSSGNDEFSAWAGGASMTVAGGNHHTLDGFEAIIALAGAGGVDTAKFYDSPGDDLFVSAPGYGTLAGNGFLLQAIAFQNVEAYAPNGGHDIARMYDSSGDDVFNATAAETTMYRSDGADPFFNRAKWFEEVRGYAWAGGHDIATLLDSTGNDVFRAGPGEGGMEGATGGGPTGDRPFLNRVKGFEEIRGEASLGGNDAASLYDSAGSDVLVATPTSASLSNERFVIEARQFDRVDAFATAAERPGVYDVASLYDSGGNDTFVSTPTYGAMIGAGFHIQATGFSGVNAYASTGGTDTARMYDSAGNDTFYAAPTEAVIWGTGFYSRAMNFEAVTAFATDGGLDEAFLVGSSGNDTFFSNAFESALAGSGFNNRVRNFQSVRAQSNAGVDTAYLYDVAVVEASTTPEGEVGVDFAKICWLYDFDELLTKDDSSNEPVEQAVDEIMLAYWSL